MIKTRQSSFILNLKSFFIKNSDPSALRTQRLKFALISSFTGKGVSVVAQLIAVPIAISSLGVERFGVYAILTALLNWFNIATVGVSPGLTAQIVSANAINDRKKEAIVFTSAFLFSVILSISLFIILHISIYFIGIERLFGAQLLNHSIELQNGLRILSVFIVANIILSVVEATQAGYQNQYINNIVLTFGSTATIFFILLVVRNWPTIPNMILAVFGAPLIARLANMTQLFVTHKYLIPKICNFNSKTLKSLLHTGCAFLLTQIGSFLYQNFTVYLVGRKLGATSAAHMSVMMLVLSLSGSLLIMFTQPLWPAIQDALIRNDFAWIKRAYSRILRHVIPCIAILACIISIYGGDLTSIWMKSQSNMNYAVQLLWGLYMLLSAWELLNYSFLIGLSRFWFASSCFFIGATIMFGISIYTVDIWGLSGIFASMCLGPLISTSWLFPVTINKILRQHN